jgi:hypothetical protein
MNAQEAYEHYDKTGEDVFLFTKNDVTLKVVFVTDAGDVYVPRLGKGFLVQNFYDGWKANPIGKSDPLT